MTSQEEATRPIINWYHVDGPLLTCSDGTPHWLTKAEMFHLKFGFTSIDKLNKLHSKEPQRG